ETGYTSKDGVARASLGVNFAEAWRVTVGTRFRRFTTASNIIPDVTDLSTRFPSLAGQQYVNTETQEFRLLWDTRDSPVTPSKGSSGELFTEKTSRALGSDADFFRYGLDGERFFVWNPKQITVIHSQYQKVNGPLIPFYELSQLGGRETL